MKGRVLPMVYVEPQRRSSTHSSREFLPRNITCQEREETILHAMVDAIPHFVWIMHPDGTFQYSNQRMRDLLNRTTDQLQGNEWIQCLHPEDRERTLALRQHALEMGKLYENEYRLQDGQTGAYRWFLARAVPVHDETG